MSEWLSTPSRQVNHESESKQRGRRGVESKSQPSFTTAAPECARAQMLTAELAEVLDSPQEGLEVERRGQGVRYRA